MILEGTEKYKNYEILNSSKYFWLVLTFLEQSEQLFREVRVDQISVLQIFELIPMIKPIYWCMTNS